ncbi:MAG: restriction endonuclease subunit S [Bacteroidales bacterium]|nr:restriction endonuclease subunit S [Bacteroidales bacterium]
MNTENWAIYNLNTIFNIEYGSKLDIIKMEENPYSDIAFVTRTATNNGITMFVNEYTDKKPYSAGIMTIALGGSIGKTFIQPFRFYTCQNVAVLLPKFKLSIYHKIFLKTIIEKECETKFVAFGRELNSHIRNDFFLKLPTANGHPDWQWMEEYVKNVLLPKLPENARQVWEKRYNNKPLSAQKLELKTEEWKWFKATSIFDMYAGRYYATDEYEIGETPLVSSAETNNGIMKFTNLQAVFPGNCITIGKVGMSNFYQPYPFCASPDVTVLKPKLGLNQFQMLFIKTVLDLDKYRWCYGNQIRLNDSQTIKIKLPATTSEQGETVPDWQWMEDYIKGLPYSGCL